ncbi:MAG TPA: hypothetical protein VIV66_22920, partial [Pyrinomonadaceae bacterium]
ENQLDPVGQELFKLRIDGIVDAAQTSYCFAFSGGFRGQGGGAIRTNDGLALQQFNLSAGVLDPLDFVRPGRTLIAGGQNCVEVAEAAPLAQMLFRVARAQDAWIFNGEFERHREISQQQTVSSKQ